MTTIALKGGIIAYDSRATIGDTIVDDDFNKRFRRNNVNFFICGAPADVAEFIECYFGLPVVKELDVIALVVDEINDLFRVGVTDEGVWKEPLETDKPFAIGSGDDHAYTAMDTGCTAREAVNMAKKRDTSTGGRTRIFKLK